MDSVLQPLLDSQDERERVRLFDDIIRVRTAPLVRKMLRQRLGIYVNPDGANRENPEAGELYSAILLNLTQRLKDLLLEPEKNPIDDYRQFVIGVATDECRNCLRAKSRPRTRLRNNLWGLLKRNGEFKVWKADDQVFLCGFTAWEGRRISIASSERLARLRENPESFKSARFAKKDRREVPYVKLITEIFRGLGDPIEFEDLVDLVALFRNVNDHPGESAEAMEEDQNLQSAFPAQQIDERFKEKEMLRKLWEELKQLPPAYRITLCLSSVGSESEDLWDLLLATDIVSLPELADGLEISLDQLMKMWLQAPMDSKTLAGYLGVTRSQVGRWRLSAVEQLRERLGGKNA